MKNEIKAEYAVCSECKTKYNKNTIKLCPICNINLNSRRDVYGLRAVRAKKLNFVQKLAFNIFRKYGITKKVSEEQLVALEEYDEARLMFCNKDFSFRKIYGIK